MTMKEYNRIIKRFVKEYNSAEAPIDRYLIAKEYRSTVEIYTFRDYYRDLIYINISDLLERDNYKKIDELKIDAYTRSEDVYE
jgi:hypothetical protein